jgi:hypothetical protein
MKKTTNLLLVFSLCILFMGFIKRPLFNQQEELKTELRMFIDTIQKNSKGRYVGYFVKIYHKDFQKKDFCFALGYFYNDFEYECCLDVNYMFYLDNRIIIANVNPITDGAIIKEFKMKKITTKDKDQILKKFCPSITCGSDSYVGRGLTYCNYKENIEKIFYNDASNMPIEASIYK